MARTITTKPATVNSKTENPYKQPAFSVFTMQYNVYGGGWIAFDHDLECYAQHQGDGDYAYNRYRTYSSYSPEFMNQWAGNQYKETTSNPSSNSECCSNTCNVGYLGHCFQPSITEYAKTAGWLYGDPSRQSYAPQGFRDNNVIVGDINQDWAWWSERTGSGSYIRLGQRSTAIYYNSRSTSRDYFNYNAQNKGADSQDCHHGGMCYNAKTKKVLIMHTNGEGKHEPVVFHNAPDLRAYALSGSYTPEHAIGTGEAYNAYSRNSGVLYDFFNPSSNNGKYTVYERANTRLYNEYSGAEESRYRTQPVICDDGQVYTFTMLPSWGACLEHWDANGTYQGRVWEQSWTTSYGYEQGTDGRFGSRWQVSSDGEYFWAWCPSYYYGSGIYWICIRVSDGKWGRFYNTDSSHGRQPCPIGKNNMFWSYSHNKDDPGLYFQVYEMPNMFAKHNNGDNWSQMDSNWSTYLLDTPGNSTGYPTIIPALYNTSLFSTQFTE